MSTNGPKPDPRDVIDFPGAKVGDGPLTPPKKLKKAEQQLWDDYIAPCDWLSGPDALLAYTFVVCYAEFMAHPKEHMVERKLAELRRMMGELGLTTSERMRQRGKGKKSKAETYFE